MSHPRKLIRAAVIARLKASSTAAGQRVFGNRAKPVQPTELPCIVVYTKNEPAEISIESPREYRRNLVVAIELIVSAADEQALDDAIDDLAEQVEAAIFNDGETFGKLVNDTVLGETEMAHDFEGERGVGMARISLTMPYFQRIPEDLTGGLDDFERMNTGIGKNGEEEPGPGIEGQDDLPQ